jgi:hypothetical protein
MTSNGMRGRRGSAGAIASGGLGDHQAVAAFDRSLSWQLDAALFLEEHAGGRLDRWLARRLRRRLEARLPERRR